MPAILQAVEVYAATSNQRRPATTATVGVYHQERFFPTMARQSVTSDSGSWMDVGADRGSCARRCFEKVFVWWRESTDVVVLNSPWLSRGTGRLFRCATILYCCCVWLLLIQVHPDNVVFSAFFYVNALCLVANFCFSLLSRRETFKRTTLFGVGMILNFYVGLRDVQTQIFPSETAALVGFALMCHCNVHPTVLLLGICNEARFLWDMTHSQNMTVGYSLFPLALFGLVFESVLVVAFTWDFTQRVMAVGSGILFGESDELLESPVAGRSARIFCWFSGVNQWILWSSTIVENQTMFDALGRQEDELFLRNHLPFSSVAVPCLSVGLILLARWRRCRNCKSSFRCRCLYMTSLEWHEDLAFALFCCAPAILLMANTYFAHRSKSFLWYDYEEEMYFRNVALAIAGVQTLIQGGCHPLICMIISAILIVGVGAPFGLFEYSANWFLLIRHVFGLLVTLILALSHLIDFFTRLPAIERGMQQSRQNAASSQMFLPSESITGLELQFLRQTTDLCLEQLVVTKPSGPATAVAVVRHAERADNMQAFDAWGCSQDAADFPHDPPITAAGAQRVKGLRVLRRQAGVDSWRVEQAEHLAHDLETQEMKFDVIVSSPFLRCLQTALILAKKFDTHVLIDQELGEVMGPPVFETEPPLPPRPWSNLEKTLKESEASSNVHSALRAGRYMGKQPQWAETLQQARLRYVKRYLDYLRRSRHTKRSFLLVTHGHMVQACATVVSVDYCGAAVAGFHKLVKEIKDGHGEAASFPADDVDLSGTPCESGACQSEPPENQILQDAKTRYWTLWLRGVRTVPSCSPSGGPNLPNVGENWDNLAKLLGTLPPVGPAPSVTDAGSDCSFSTRASTAVSMNMLREPDGVPTSPKQSEKKQERHQRSRVDAKPPPAPPPLTLSTSRLAARRLKKPNVPETVAEDQV
eukprot:Skav211547  [mRNA]  locus=scaffold871:73636:79434:- [translate_table: standard]